MNCRQFVPYLQERDHLNNLLGSFIDMKRTGMKKDSDGYGAIDQINPDSIQNRNEREAKKFILRKMRGYQGDKHRMN